MTLECRRVLGFVAGVGRFNGGRRDLRDRVLSRAPTRLCRTVDRVKTDGKYGISERRHKKLFDHREGETPEQMIARQLAMARPFEVAWLTLVRGGDDTQLRAIEMLQAARSVWWSKIAVASSLAATVVSVVALVRSV